MAKMKAARGFEPNWATHPGEHIEEYLEVNGWSQAELARQAGLTPKLVSEVLNQKNPVTPDTALKLEKALGLKAEIWMGLQTRWDLLQARRRMHTISAQVDVAKGGRRASRKRTSETA